MDRTVFWGLMEQTKRIDKDNRDKQFELLIQELVKFSEAELISFDEIFSELMIRAYDRNLWAAAYIINCGCSDDGFTDFRAWLIGQGQTIFEKALEDPECLVDIVEYPHLTQPIHLFAVSSKAYRLKTGQNLPPRLSRHHDHPAPTENDWEASTVGEKYPKLYAKFGDCKELIDSLNAT